MPTIWGFTVSSSDRPPGVKIGNNSVIAANSVVRSDVPENALYAGTPAVFKRDI
ncbi:hypothetical protein NA256_22895 [Salmonella sp. NW805]|nr:hypothetical protein [Salmonella enterica]HBM0507495.1 hypothetical protein [Salmonella enterica]